MNQERLEEVRRQQEEKLVVLHETDDLHLRQLSAWLERLDSWGSEQEQRHARLASKVEAVLRDHDQHLLDLEQRDERLIDAMLMALRTRMEEIKAEQVERGRTPADT